MVRRYMDLMHLGFNEVAQIQAKLRTVPPPFSTVEQVAERLGISVEELYRALKSRKQPKEPR